LDSRACDCVANWSDCGFDCDSGCDCDYGYYAVSPADWHCAVAVAVHLPSFPMMSAGFVQAAGCPTDSCDRHHRPVSCAFPLSWGDDLLNFVVAAATRSDVPVPDAGRIACGTADSAALATGDGC